MCIWNKEGEIIDFYNCNCIDFKIAGLTCPNGDELFSLNYYPEDFIGAFEEARGYDGI